MARNAQDVLTRKNNKLEAFLKKNLDADTFEKIRAYESCVVCSEKEDKAFKFVVISDEWIYLTENPPKKVQETVHLSDISSVELVNEFPDFLSGEERNNCLHIVIKYLTTKPLKGRKSSRKNGSPKISRSTPSSPSRQHSRGSLSARNSIAVDRLAYSAREPSNRKESLRTLTSRSLPEKRVQFDSLNSKFGKTLTVPGQDVNQNNLSPQVLKKNLAKKRTLSLDPSALKKALENVEGSGSSLDLALTPRGGKKNDRTNQSKLSGGSKDLADKRKRGTLKGSYGSSGEWKMNLLNGLSEESEEDDSDEDGDVTLEVPSITVPPLDLKSDGDDDSISTLGSTFGTDDAFEAEGRRMAVLHLYILNYSSQILNLTKSAWNNYLIRATLEEDPQYLFKRDAFTTGKPKGTSEKLEMLFCQLRNELLSPNNAMEDNFNLLSELKSAADRTFAIKKLFWKTSELFTYLVRLLQKYLPKSPVINYEHMSPDAAKDQRADELEFVILIVETLSVMFRETEMLSARFPTLKAGKGQATQDLLVVLTCIPEMPKEYASPSNKGHSMLRSSTADRWTGYADVELSKLAEELTNAVTVVLFEVMLVAHQAHWGDSKGTFFNINWMVTVLDDLSTIEHFFDRVISSSMRLISPTDMDEVTPQEAILLYCQFSLIQTMVEYSPKITKFIKNNFYEEFKYYIQAPVILQKLPKKYLLSSYTIHLMEEVLSVILHRKVKLNDNRAF